MSDMMHHVETLIKRAAEEKDALYAMQLSQAACNAANAARIMQDVRLEKRGTASG